MDGRGAGRPAPAPTWPWRDAWSTIAGVYQHRAGSHPAGRSPAGPSSPSGSVGGAWLGAALILLALALRAHRLAAQSLWSDEDITLDRALRPLAEMLRALPVEQGPLYYLLMRPWTLLAGSSDLALRWPSLLASVLAVALGLALGRRLAGRRAGAFLGLILALSPFLVYYGQEARGYALLFCLALALPLALLRAESVGRRRDWLLVGLLAAATLLTHAYGLLALLPLLAWPLLGRMAGSQPDRARYRGYALAAATAALAYLPWLSRALGLLEHEGWRAGWPLAGAAWANLVAWSSGTRADWSPGAASPAAQAATLLLLALGLGGLALLLVRIRLGVSDQGRAARLLTLGLLPPAAYGCILAATSHATAAGGRLADYDPRYFTAGLGGFYLLAAVGAAGLGRPAAHILTVALLALAALPSLHCLYTQPVCQKPDYRALLAQVAAPARDPSRQTVLYTSTHDEDTVLLLDGPSDGLARRYRAEGMPVKVVRLPAGGDAAARERTRARLDELAGEYASIWLVEDGQAAGEAARWLAARAYPVSDAALQNWRLRRYLLPPDEAKEDAAQGASESALTPLAQAAAGGLALGILRRPAEGAGEFALQGVAGQVLALRLGWEAPGAAGVPARLSLRLLPGEPVEAAAGAGDRAAASALAGVDRPILAWWSDRLDPSTGASSAMTPARPWLDRQGLALPADLAPGVYRLELRAYDAGDAGQPPVDRLVAGLPLRILPPLPDGRTSP